MYLTVIPRNVMLGRQRRTMKVLDIVLVKLLFSRDDWFDAALLQPRMVSSITFPSFMKRA